MCSPSCTKTISKSSNWKFPTGRKAKILPSTVEKSNKQSRDTKLGIRVKSGFLKRTTSTKTSPSSKNVKGRKSFSEPRGGCHVGERCNPKGSLSKGPISEQYFYCPQETGGQQTSNQSQTSKCLYTLPSLQNGRFTSSERSVERERLHVQDRFERRLLLCSSSPESTKVYSFSMGGRTVRIPLSLFRACTSTSDFHETSQNSNCSIEKDLYQINNLSGRYSIDGKVHFRTEYGQRHSNFSLSTVRISDKPEEISTDPNKDNRILRSGSRFKVYDSDITKRKDNKSPEKVHQLNIRAPHNSGRNSQSIRFFVFNGSSCTSSSSSGQVPSVSVHSVIEEKSKPPITNYSQSGVSSGVKLVGKQPGTLKWQVNSERGQQQDNNSDRCIEEGLGCILSKQISGGTMDPPRESFTHKHSRVDCNKTCSTNFCEDFQIESCTLSDRQYDSPSISGENGGDSEQGNDSISKGNLGFCSAQGNHDHCRVSPRDIECKGRPSIKVFPGLQRMAAVSQNLPPDFSQTRVSLNRSVCIQGMSPDSTLHVLEARPTKSGSGCISTELADERSDLCISSVFSDRQSSKKSKNGEGYINLNNPTLASSIVVQPNFGNLHKKSITSNLSRGSTLKSAGRDSSISRKQNSKFNGMDNFRKGLLAEGISAGASDLIVKARRGGTTSNYESAWGKWVCWCIGKQVDPHGCTLTFVLDFLAHLFEQNFEYSTINSHRSAISAYHDKIDNYSVGKHPKVCSLMTGVFNQRPPKPKYIFVWDVDQVLSYLKTLPDNVTITNRTMNLKLATLLFLTSSNRCHEICYLDIRYMVKTLNSYQFYFTKVTKTWKKGQPPPMIEFKEFPQNSNLCVVKCLTEYLQRSKVWRKDGQNQLLLSHLNPHVEVKSSTISNWVKLVLKFSGIDVAKYQAHSCRSASTSKAKALGLSLNEILQRGQWSNESTWQKYYNKQIENQPRSDIILQGH